MKAVQVRGEILESLSLSELCSFCRADEDWVVELVSYGVLEPEGSARQEWQFRGVNIVRAKKARRLYSDLGINVAGVAMVLDLLQERERILHRLSMVEED